MHIIFSCILQCIKQTPRQIERHLKIYRQRQLYTYTPCPWCPTHSAVSGWHCQSSVAAVVGHHLLVDMRPPCMRNLQGERHFLTIWLCVWAWNCLCARSKCVPVGFVGRDSSLRFSSHSWSCFFTLLMRVFWRETIK